MFNDHTRNKSRTPLKHYRDGTSIEIYT